jgi:hypothetical protein
MRDATASFRDYLAVNPATAGGHQRDLASHVSAQ